MLTNRRLRERGVFGLALTRSNSIIATLFASGVPLALAWMIAPYASTVVTGFELSLFFCLLPSAAAGERLHLFSFLSANFMLTVVELCVYVKAS